MKNSPLPPGLTPEEVAAGCRELGCPVPEEALEPLRVYVSLLLRWNRAMNLVGAKNAREALVLCADSLYLAEFLKSLPLPAEPTTWDLGAGAGLPGIPLRMLWRAGDYTMVEIREKRVIFMQRALAELKLPRTFAVRARAEEFFAREAARGARADLIVSRAFMPPEKLPDFVAPGLAPDGLLCIAASGHAPFVPPPGRRVEAESAYEVQGARRRFAALRRME